MPIIALTAHDDPAIKTKALAAGMDDYLVKPLTQQSAHYILDKYCNKRNFNRDSTRRKDHNKNR
jgi:CheY-like chemotaxis protein